MKYRHYAPKAKLTAICGGAAKTAEYIRNTANTGDGILCYDEFSNLFDGFPYVIPFGRSDDHAGQARRLFGALREFDETPVSAIFAQCPEEDGLGLAVSNRLKKAAGFQVIDLK
jgi:L-threonylcarbamoyladenylate synthase